MTILTIKQLEARRACSTQVDLFRETFGEEVDVTEALCLSVSDKFSWDWAARNLLPEPVWAEYKRVRASTSAGYDRAKASAWAEFDRGVRASTSAGYDRAKASAWAEFDRVRASAFGRLAEGLT